jgi:LysM repeat protein
VDSSNLHRRPHKIRRTGRHATPSQVEKVAGTAAKAAPAVAIAGALVALPQSAHAEAKTPASATTVTEQAHTTALVKKAAASRTYTVRSGDTLSAIAKRFYGNAAHWTWIYAANRSKIHNPNSIFVGEKLTIPSHAPTGTAAYTPRHAKKPQSTVLTSSAKKLSGNLSCSGLEALWKARLGVHRGRDRHGRIRRQAVRPQPDQRLRLLADQRRPRSHGHVQPDQERQGRDRHLQQRAQLAPVDHVRHRRVPRSLLGPR